MRKTGGKMNIIDFEKAKARRQSKGKVTKHFTGTDKGVLELRKQYQNYAQFCNRWYDEHVIGQDKDGGWIYKDL